MPNRNHPLLFLGLLLCVWQMTLAQEENPTTWPYGGIPDTTRKQDWMDKPPLNFIHLVVFHKVTFSQTADFWKAKFDSTAHFWEATFLQTADFWRAVFSQDANFSVANFHRNADFTGATFSQTAYFVDATFSQTADFGGAIFLYSADFFGATFKEMPKLEGSEFGKVLKLSGANFEKGADLRRARFDSVKTIYVNHHTDFPVGKLYLYWEQFQGKDQLRIKLDEPAPDHNEHYQRLETFYHRLRDNFLAQGDKASADAVMYELGWQKREIYGFWSWTGFWQTLYYWFFGYGYQPWRFLLFVVLPLIIIFAFVWYWFYYGILVRIINERIDLDLIPNKTRKVKFKVKEKTLLKSNKILNQGIKLKFYDHTQMEKGLNRLSRYWHVLHFSTSVLLGIRFKKEWIKVNPPETAGQKSFIYLVTFEWLLGISLYVIFAILVKSNQFAYIKGLLGF